MTKLARNALRFALAATAGTVCLFINDNMSTVQWSSLITQADARMSVAGERRRHARRAVRRSYAARYGAGGYYGPMPLTRALIPFTLAAITALMAATLTGLITAASQTSAT